VRLLDAVPEDASGETLADLQGRLEGALLPAPVELLPLSELEGKMDEEVLDHLHAEIAAGRRRGHSARLPSSIVFAWRTLRDGRTLVATSPADHLRADDGRSALIFVSLLLVSAGLAFCVAHLLSADVSHATAMIRSEVERLARGDLRRGRVFESEDELGELARRITRDDAAAWEDRALRREVGHMAGELDALWAMVKYTVSEAGKTGVPGMGASCVKLFYTELKQRLGELSLKLLGRAALSRDDIGGLPVAELSHEALQSLSLTIAAGSSQIQRNIISERIMGLPREPR